MTQRTGRPPGRTAAAKKSRTNLPCDPPILLENMGTGRSIADYPAGRIVFTQGDAADAVFYLQEGKVKVTVVSKEGRAAVLAIVGPSQFFGETCLAQPLRMSTAVALSDSIIVAFEKPAMLRVLRDRPEFSEFFITHLICRTIRIEEDLVDQLFNSTEKRLARVLLLLANFGKESQPDLTLPKFSHQMLAEMIGATRSRVNFFMNKFRKLGFIEYNDVLHVDSSLLNIILLGQEPAARQNVAAVKAGYSWSEKKLPH